MEQRIKGTTGLLALIGSPVGHSGSPAMYNFSFQYHNLDYAYMAFDIKEDQVPAALDAMRLFKMRGCNVTMPCKNKVAQCVDELSPAAKIIGAVNTIVNEDGKLVGHITDGIGFVRNLKEHGVGEIVIFNRKDEFWGRAVSTVEKINTRTSSHAVLYDLADLDQLKKEMADSYIFVNATGVGMKPLEGQSVVPDKSCFRPELIVVDVPYSPLETAMRSMAKEVGCKTMNGLGMMLFQGSAAFELWTGEPMPIEHMKEILNIRYDD